MPAVHERLCLRCGHTWFPRQQGRPNQCPNRRCHSVIWDKPPKEKSQ